MAVDESPIATMKRKVKAQDASLRFTVSASFALSAMAGCAVGPNWHRPHPPMPDAWSSATTQPSTQPSALIADPADVRLWWTRFSDPTLNSLIDRSIESNLDLRSATERLREVRAQRGVVGAGFFPELDGSGSYRRSGSEGASSDRVVNGVTRSSGGSSDLYQAGLDASWEVDIFGAVRRSYEAANADIRTAVEDRRDVLVTLTSEVALNYLALRGYQRQIEIALQNLDAQRRSAELTRTLFNGGFVSGLDLANAEALVASTEAQIPQLQTSTRQTIHALSVLLGRDPSALVAELEVAGPLPAVPPNVPVGLPSDLLRRRADIRRAEAALHAAIARVGVATADLFPRFSLNGSVSLSGDQPKALTSWNNSFWSFGPSVSVPLFDAGRRFAALHVQDAVAQQAYTSYKNTILLALRDVENALVAYENEQKHRVALSNAVTANRRAVDLATQLYQQGQTDFLNVLTAERSLYSTEDALVQSDRTIATNLVALYKALGGGWEDVKLAN